MMRRHFTEEIWSLITLVNYRIQYVVLIMQQMFVYTY